MNVDAPRCYSFADAQERSLPKQVSAMVHMLPLYRVPLRIGNDYIELVFSDRLAAALFRERYTDMHHPNAMPGGDVFYAIQAGAQLYLWSRPERAWVVDIPTLEPHLVAFFADNAMMLDFIEQRRVLSMHGAVLGYRDRACAVLGVSTAGKSTTAVAAAETGFDFYSDERCLLEDGRVTPFPRAITLRPQGRRRLLIDAGIDSEYLRAALRAADGAEDFTAAPSQLLPRIGTKPIALRAIFLISGYALRPAIMRGELYDMLPELMLSMTMRERGLDRMARALHELQNLHVFRVMLGAPSETAHMIAEVLHDVA